MPYNATKQERLIAQAKWISLLSQPIAESRAVDFGGVTYHRPTIKVNNSLDISIQAGYGHRCKRHTGTNLRDGKDITSWSTVEMALMHVGGWKKPGDLDPNMHMLNGFFQDDGPGSYVPLNIALVILENIFFQQCDFHQLQETLKEEDRPEPERDGDVNLFNEL